MPQMAILLVLLALLVFPISVRFQVPTKPAERVRAVHVAGGIHVQLPFLFHVPAAPGERYVRVARGIGACRDRRAVC